MLKIKNPFRLEEYRTQLAKKCNRKKFKDTYTASYPHIEDTNSPTFWDKENVVMETLTFPSNPMAVHRANFIAKKLGKGKEKTLDVGFGSGIVEEIYHKLFPTSPMIIYGIDFSYQSVRSAKKRFPKDKYMVGSILEIPHKDASFHNVTCLEVMEHIIPSKTFQAMHELHRVLKPHGKLILSVPLNEGLEEMIENGVNPNHHVRVYSPEIIRMELSLAGFRVIKQKYLYAFGKYYYLKSFISRFFLKNKLPNNIVLIARKI